MKLKLILIAFVAAVLGCSKSKDPGPSSIPCLLTMIADTVINNGSRSPGLTYKFEYDSKGNLLSWADYDFVWQNGVVVGVELNGVKRVGWFYTNGRLTKVIDYSNTGDTISIYNLTLNAAGQPTEISDVLGGDTYTYDSNGNISSIYYDSNPLNFSDYDTKKNPMLKIAAALNLSFWHLSLLLNINDNNASDYRSSFSKNNPGALTITFFGGNTLTFTYTYDAKGNVTKQTYTYSIASYSVQRTFVYSNCN